MIYITGDTHRRTDHWKLVKFAEEHPELTKDDYVIIAGDFGGVWSKNDLDEDLNIYSRFPFTTLFVDGNHENFDLLNSYSVTEWRGGKVHIIRPDIIHLMRGQVFEIADKTFFTFGGATSIDKAVRLAYGWGWWEEELPTFDDLSEAFRNLERVNNKVDFIITHSCDERALYYPPLRTRTTMMSCYPENQMLSNFEDNVDYRHWYFGHYHMDGDLTGKKTVLYHEIRKIV